MTYSLSTKLVSSSVALLVNAVMIGAVAQLFNGQIHQPLPTALAQATSPMLHRSGHA